MTTDNQQTECASCADPIPADAPRTRSRPTRVGGVLTNLGRFTFCLDCLERVGGDVDLLTWMVMFPRCSHQGCLSDEVFERTSFGCYAGRYCDKHWATSGYRDATDVDAEFDPMDAGESLEPDWDGGF